MRGCKTFLTHGTALFTRFMSRLALTLVCCLSLPEATGSPSADIREAIELALGPTDEEDRARAIARLVQMKGAGQELVHALLDVTGKRRAQLAILLGAVTDKDALPQWLLSDHPFVEAGCLEREILASAYLEKVLIAYAVRARKVTPPGRSTPLLQEAGDAGVLAVVDRIYQDPNWRTRRIAARLLSTVQGSERTPAFQALRQDEAWPVRAHTAPAAVLEKEDIKERSSPPPKGSARVGNVIARALSKVEALYCPEVLLEAGIPNERCDYKVRAKWSLLHLRTGSLTTTITHEPKSGARGYRIHQAISVGGRYQDEDAFIDEYGLFPYRYKLVTSRPGGTHCEHLVLWDHLGGRIYLSKLKKGGKPQYAEWDMGIDERCDSRDPLSAMLIYRLMCGSRARPMDWTVPVLMSRDERYNLRVRAASSLNSGEEVAAVWEWTARKSDGQDKTVTSWFRFSPTALPVRYATHSWGVRGTAKLRKHTVQTNAVPRGPRSVMGALAPAKAP